MKFCMNICLKNLCNPIEFQGHRSKVKVTWVFWVFFRPGRFLHNRRQNFVGGFYWQTKSANFIGRLTWHGVLAGCSIPLVPVFGFGENDLYHQVANPVGSRLRRLQTLMTKVLTFSPPLFHGRGVLNYTFGLLPFRHPVNVVGQSVSPSIDLINVFFTFFNVFLFFACFLFKKTLSNAKYKYVKIQGKIFLEDDLATIFIDFGLLCRLYCKISYLLKSTEVIQIWEFDNLHMTQCAKIIAGFVANVGNVFYPTFKRFYFLPVFFTFFNGFDFHLNVYYIYVSVYVFLLEYLLSTR